VRDYVGQPLRVGSVVEDRIPQQHDVFGHLSGPQREVRLTSFTFTTSAAMWSYAGSSGLELDPIGSTRTRELSLSMVTRAPCSSASRRK
jgi:hypothetical protein